MKSKSSTSLIIAACLLLVVAGTVGEGAFRWVMIAIALVIGLVLAIRASKKT